MSCTHTISRMGNMDDPAILIPSNLDETVRGWVDEQFTKFVSPCLGLVVFSNMKNPNSKDVMFLVFMIHAILKHPIWPKRN